MSLKRLKTMLTTDKERYYQIWKDKDKKDVINLRRPQTRKGCHPYAKKNAALLAREFSTVSACQRVMRPMTLASFRKLSDALLLVVENDS